MAEQLPWGDIRRRLEESKRTIEMRGLTVTLIGMSAVAIHECDRARSHMVRWLWCAAITASLAASWAFVWPGEWQWPAGVAVVSAFLAAWNAEKRRDQGRLAWDYMDGLKDPVSQALQLPSALNEGPLEGEMVSIVELDMDVEALKDLLGLRLMPKEKNRKPEASE